MGGKEDVTIVTDAQVGFGGGPFGCSFEGGGLRGRGVCHERNGTPSSGLGSSRVGCRSNEEDWVTIERPAFTIGIEEEYLLVDPATRDLVRDPGDQVMAECQAILGSQVSPEFLKAQVEVGTRVAPSVGEARDDLRRLRSALFEVVDRHGLALIAASTHPFADWADQQVTERDRYLLLAKDLQVVVRRLVICGMHVHVGIEDPEVRIDLMNQVSYFLPHLLALSTSSPFWHGMESGLKAYRLSVFRSLPRTGIPEQFSSWAEYRRHVDALVAPGLIEDASKLWWDVRPSERYPTLELRISDVCTRIDDGMAVAALFQSILAIFLL